MTDGTGPYVPGVTVAPRPAPVVRVSDPRAPDRPSCAAPPTAEPVEERERVRRGVLPLVLLLVGLAVGAGGSELRHAQQERVREAAAAQVLDLRLEGAQESYGASMSSDARTIVLSRDLAVRNVGGRPVRVLGAQLVGGAMASGGIGRDLPQGDDGTLVLSGAVRCPGGSPRFAPPASVLRVRAQTAAGERTADLPVPAAVLAEMQSTADRTCGILPLEESLRVQEFRSLASRGRLAVDVEVGVASSEPVDLIAVDVLVPGVHVELRAGGRRTELPLRLDSAGPWPRPDGPFAEPVLLQAVLRVADCRALRAYGRQVEGPVLQVLVARPGGTQPVSLPFETLDVGRLLADACAPAA